MNVYLCLAGPMSCPIIRQQTLCLELAQVSERNSLMFPARHGMEDLAWHGRHNIFVGTDMKYGTYWFGGAWKYIVNARTNRESKNPSWNQELIVNPRTHRESRNPSWIQELIVNPGTHRESRNSSWIQKYCSQNWDPSILPFCGKSWQMLRSGKS